MKVISKIHVTTVIEYAQAELVLVSADAQKFALQL